MNIKKRKKKKNNRLITILFILTSIIYTTFSNEINNTFGLPYQNTTSNTNKKTEEVILLNDNLKIHYIDVGQADSILIENNNEYMLIDGGNNVDGPLLVDYFNSLGIEEFKYLVATHPHEDHIGGLDSIIDNFDIGTIYMPDAITTTRTFEDLLDSIERKNLTYTIPIIDNTFKLNDCNFKIIYTGTDTKDLNNTSIILKMTYNNTSFLFTGDATDITEEKILSKDIKADVLKVGHHGSKYSTTDKFLNKVNPKYAIISVGIDNKYNHPATSTINKLEKNNIETYRTDQNGTIIATSDGNNITFKTIKTNTNGG